MLSGCVLSLSSIYLFGLDGQIISPAVFPNICQIKTWVLSIGFTLGYGAMYSKVWRVHRLHTSQKKNAIRVIIIILTTLVVFFFFIILFQSIRLHFRKPCNRGKCIRSLYFYWPSMLRFFFFGNVWIR